MVFVGLAQSHRLVVVDCGWVCGRRRRGAGRVGGWRRGEAPCVGEGVGGWLPQRCRARLDGDRRLVVCRYLTCTFVIHGAGFQYRMSVAVAVVSDEGYAGGISLTHADPGEVNTGRT
ncbi:hypothetical protein GCM10018779_67030 [Streptomyces griseocarneus]|nr:hypothetical protein GCM10018779_67030 [Streptomyces griseocarneus]